MKRVYGFQLEINEKTTLEGGRLKKGRKKSFFFLTLSPKYSSNFGANVRGCRRPDF